MLYDVTLPPDLVVHKGPSIAASEKPWSIPGYKFSKVWEKATGAGVKVCIIDTGYQEHDILPEPLEYINLTNETSRLLNSHGIHCAGSALGRDGYGVAPNAELIAIKVLAGRGGSGSSDWIAAGIRKAADLGADVISLSLGGPSAYRPTKDSLAYAFDKGAVVVAAAGNSGFNGRQNTMGYPAKFGENVIAVGATKAPYEDQKLASFSSGGREMDLVAPGENILSAVSSNRLGIMSGTSMATPWLAGAYALLIEILRLSGKPRPVGYKAWKSAFTDLATDLGTPDFDQYYGYGWPRPSSIAWLLDNAIAEWGI